jgi:hypothetical protein
MRPGASDQLGETMDNIEPLKRLVQKVTGIGIPSTEEDDLFKIIWTVDYHRHVAPNANQFFGYTLAAGG